MPRVAVSLDGYVDDRGIDGADPEALGRVDLDPKIVPARTRARQGPRRRRLSLGRDALANATAIRARVTFVSAGDQLRAQTPRADCDTCTGTPVSSRSTGAGDDVDRDPGVLRLAPAAPPNRRSRRSRRRRTRARAPVTSTGSVVAPVSRRSRLSGPATSTVRDRPSSRRSRTPAPARRRAPAPPEPSAGRTSPSRAQSCRARPAPLRRRMANAHFVGAQVKQPRPGRADAEVEDGDDLTGLDAAEQRRRPAQPDIDCGRRIADDLQRLRECSGTPAARACSARPDARRPP